MHTNESTVLLDPFKKEIAMFKEGDTVYLNVLGRSDRGIGSEEYSPNPCAEKLLAGEGLEIHSIVPVYKGASAVSVRFEGGAYSFSPDYFQHESLHA
jgi:hypothetical protein